jgi:hypothetical protein
LIAGIVEHHLREARLPLPSWVDEPTRVIDQPWFVDDVPGAHDGALRTTPAGLLRHGVVLSAAELDSV